MNSTDSVENLIQSLKNVLETYQEINEELGSVLATDEFQDFPEAVNRIVREWFTAEQTHIALLGSLLGTAKELQESDQS